MTNYKIYINILIIFLIGFLPLESFADKSKKGEKFVVVIDAGHGGKDIGATDNGVMEKNINLSVALQLESLIKKKLKNTEVIMTRDDDSYLTLQERADIANKNKGHLFISIHTNSVDKKNKNRKTIAGSSVYALGLHKDDSNMQVAQRENSVIELESDYRQKYSGFDPLKDESYIIFEMAQKKNLSQSIKFAESVEKELVKSGRNDRGVHQAGFWVLWATSMPSVLVELDFICNPESAQYLSSSKGAKELAEAIYKAVVLYEENWRKASTETVEIPKVSDDKKVKEVIIAAVSESEIALPDEDVVAVARTRKKKTPEEEVKKNNSASMSRINSGKRKRRSATAKLTSSSTDYEKAIISPVAGSDYALVSADLAEDASSVSKTDNKKDNKKSSKEKKSKEKKQKKEKKAKEKKNSNTHSAKIEKFVTVYKIQILASSELLKQNNARFCGLSPISTYKENNLYKYYYGESTDRQEVESMLVEVRKKIPDAFIVSSTKTMSSSKK